jgi:putative nucleotidyltransferase with HDIG domain
MERKRFSALPRAARIYVVCVVAAGAYTVGHAGLDLFRQPPHWDWIILALLTLVSGSAPVRLPALPATISVSETFVITSVLLFGASAGTITVALDALVLSAWAYQRKGQPFYKSLFNVSALPLSVWVASHLFFQLAGVSPLGLSAEGAIGTPIKDILVPLVAFTVSYFCLNSGIIAFAISLEKHLSAVRIWRDNFVWLSLNYFGGTSVAVLLVTYARHVDLAYLAVIIPLLFIVYFTYSMSMGRVEDANRHLTQLNTLYMSTIETLAMAIDAKDQITHGHIRRVQTYAVGLAKRMGVSDEAVLRAVEAAALLHDMGKLAVPEYILNKPGPLTTAEFEKMKLHASVGADILSAIDFPYPVVPIVRHHHENWDGSGYPDGLAGSAIPIGARILSVVDCFDALTSDRPYRPRLSDHEAIRILVDRRGKMYDPLIVDTFIAVYRDLAPSTVGGTEQLPLRAITAATTASGSAASRFDEISGSSEEVVTLLELARGLKAEAALDDLCENIFGHVRRLIPASLCVFYVHEIDADELVAAHVSGESAPLLSRIRIAIGQRVSGWVAAHRQSIRNSDPALDLGGAARAMTARPKSTLSTPILEHKTLVGVLTLYSTHVAAFTEEHERILQAVAAQVAAPLRDAYERSRMVKNGVLTHTKQHGALSSIGKELLSATAMILVKVTRSQSHEGSGEFGTLRIARDLLATCVRTGDEIIEVPDGIAAILPHADVTIAEAICRRFKDLWGVREPNSRAHAVVVTAPEDGASLLDLLANAKARLSQNPRSDSVH